MSRLGFVIGLICVSAFGGCAATVDAPSKPSALVRDDIKQKIDALLAKMTLEEKIGQLNQFSDRADTGPGNNRGDYRKLVAAGRIGSILNATGSARTNELQKIAVEQSRLGIPILFGLDVIHGYFTTFPIPIALSCTWNPELIEQTSAVAAREARADGIRWTFSPMVDIARDPRWGRIAEGAGEDPFLGAAIGRAYVRGYHGESLSGTNSIASCAKHYVGYGAAEGGRDYNSTEISERTLREVYLPPFKAAVDEGVPTLMSAFNAINGVPASANAHTLNDILRGEWGFGGFVVSDWTSIKETIPHGTALDGVTAARRAFLAGVDMDMEAELYLNHLADEVSAGRVTMAAIDEAVRRVLRVKFVTGLFENPYTPTRDAIPPIAPSDFELARTAAEQSFVLLKNEGSALPLRSDLKSIALIGPLADASEQMLGTWAARGDKKNVVTLQSSLTDFAAQKKIDLVVAKGCEIDGFDDSSIAAAVEAAKRAEVVILAVGESRGMSGEAASRTKLDLPGVQPKLVEAIAATGKPVILVVFSGRPLVLTPYVDRAAAVVQAWHPGIAAGPALVRVLSGAADFTGRLTTTFPRSLGQIPLYYNHLNTGRPLVDGVDSSRAPHKPRGGFTSRYLDEFNAPLFPFGFGLSYTQFTYAPPKLDRTELSAAAVNRGSQNVKVTASVTNSGSRDGTEIVQLYIRQQGTSVARPVRELKGFARVQLRRGETKQVAFTLGRDELAFWNVDMKYVVEPAKLTVFVGADCETGNGVEVMIRD